MIHLWNAISDNLLSSKYDPFQGSNRKVVLDCSDEDSYVSTSTKCTKNKSPSPNKRRENTGSPSTKSSEERETLAMSADT